jgi:esterase/lipase superfamily enzyme
MPPPPSMLNILAIHASDAEPLLKWFGAGFKGHRISFFHVRDRDELRSTIFAASDNIDICLLFSSDQLASLLRPLHDRNAPWLNRYVLAQRRTVSVQLNLKRQSQIVRAIYRDLFHAVRAWPGRPLLSMSQVDLVFFIELLRSELEGTRSIRRDPDGGSTFRWSEKTNWLFLRDSEPNKTNWFLRDSDPRIAELLFATNRASMPNSPPDFGADRTDELKYGACRVRIPEDHKIGHLELPNKASWIRLRFRNEELDERRHFVIKDIATFDQTEFCNIILQEQSKTALVFVHGFNTTFNDGVLRLAQIIWDMQFKGVSILFSWPSAGGVLKYLYDLNSALGARPRFQELIQMLRTDAGVETIHIVAHSMGNMVVLEALNELAKAGALPTLSEVVMAAPDVDIDLYKSLAVRIRPLTRGMTLYASANDKALVASRKAAGKPRAGDVFAGRPIVLPQIESIDVSAIGDEMFGLNHNVFADNRSLIDDIGRLLFKGDRPPNQRSPQIRCVPEGIDPPEYWRYVP